MSVEKLISVEDFMLENKIILIFHNILYFPSQIPCLWKNIFFEKQKHFYK
jgi:hypothetical protein